MRSTKSNSKFDRSQRRSSNRRLNLENLENRTVMAGDCFHNFMLPEDADANGSVTPLDALVVIDRINQSLANGPSRSNATTDLALVDVDADNSLSPLDALGVINHLNSQTSMGSGAARASRVEHSRRIERIEQAIASNLLPPNFSLQDAHGALDTLRSGGRPELGDHVVNGILKWRQDDNPSTDDSSGNESEQPQETRELKRLEHFIDSLSKRLEAFNVSPSIIATISSELLSAHQSGSPLDLMQVRDRLAQLGVDVDTILPQAARPEIPECPEISDCPEVPESPEMPERPENPERPERPIMPTIVVTEPIADSILARLKNAGISAEILGTIRDEIYAGINAGLPLDLQVVRSRLEELGIDWERLHAPPVNTLPVVRPRLDGAAVLEQVLPFLGRLGIQRDVALRIYMEAKAALVAGKPLSIDQIVARLKALGVSLDSINKPVV
jgi:hypothetical protein